MVRDGDAAILGARRFHDFLFRTGERGGQVPRGRIVHFPFHVFCVNRYCVALPAQFLELSCFPRHGRSRVQSHIAPVIGAAPCQRMAIGHRVRFLAQVHHDHGAIAVGLADGAHLLCRGDAFASRELERFQPAGVEAGRQLRCLARMPEKRHGPGRLRGLRVIGEPQVGVGNGLAQQQGGPPPADRSGVVGGAGNGASWRRRILWTDSLPAAA